MIRYIVFNLITMMLIVTSCSSNVVHREIAVIKAPAGQSQKEAILIPEELDKIDPLAYHHWTNGTIFESAGQYYQASESYRKALEFYPDSYEIRYSLAMVLFRIQHIDDMITILSTIDPVNAEIWDLRGAAYRALGKEDSARMSYRKSVELDPDNATAYSYLVSDYRKNGFIDSTAWACENICRLNPNNYRMWHELGKIQFQLGNLDSAQSAFQHSIELRADRSNTMSFVGLGEIYQVKEQTDSAIQAYNLALEVDPDNILVHRRLVDVYIFVNSPDSALYHCQREVELAPLDRAASRRLGMLYYFMDSLDTAKQVFSALVSTGDRHPLNYKYLGRIAVRNNDYETALTEFGLLVQMDDTTVENWFDLAYAYRLMKQPEQEIQTYQIGLEKISAKNEEGRNRLMFAQAAAYEFHKQFDKAVAKFEELIDQSADNDQALNYLGYLLADRGERLQYARELIKRAVAIAPDNAAYLDSYGWVFYRLGEYDQALIHLKKAVELDSDPVIFDHLGDAYEAGGDTSTARQWWQKALELDPENKDVKEKLNR